MTRTIRNRLVQIAMTGALAITGWPLAAPFLPARAAARPEAGWGKATAAEGRIVVDARDGITEAQLAELNARHGLQLRLNSIHAAEEDLLVAPVPESRREAVLAALRREPLVEAAEPSRVVVGLWKPNDPRYSEQWNLHLIGAERAWDRKATGKGVTVAVIDTGVAAEEDERCYQARDFGGTAFAPGYDFVHDDGHPFDDNGHGTHVAGTIAETTDNGEGAAGLAYEATIMPLKVLDNWGTGRSEDIADAIRYAADHGAQVINMSLGSPFPDRVMQLACAYAREKGVLIVCAAGNSGGAVGYPAAFPECLAVSAVGPDGNLAPYSSRGKEIALAAPGGYTRDRSRLQDGVLQNTLLDGDRSTDGYYAFEGTSMASPHVAAAAALIMARGERDPEAVRQALLRAATPKKPASRYGAGLLNVDTATAKATGARPAPIHWLPFLLLGALVLTGACRAETAGGGAGAAVLGLGCGLFGPDLLSVWLGLGTPWQIVLHSALIPLYLLWESESRGWYRLTAGLALGLAVHLAWDAFWGGGPFGRVLPFVGIPWLWVNGVVALGVAGVAWARSRAT
jgi:serine protease